MALAHTLLTLCAVAAFSWAFACLGNRLLNILGFAMDSDADHLFVAIGVGLLSTEVLLFFVQFAPSIRGGMLVVIALLCILVLLDSAAILHRLRNTLHHVEVRSSLARFLIILMCLVLLTLYLTATAPLTGSDAMNYHFATQKAILDSGFHPLFSSSHSFFCGQHHLLILFGLALGSEKLALGLLFLGGLLSAALLANLVLRWASESIALAVTLLFVLAPVVFWQMSSSGAPDIYIAFFTALVLLVLLQPSSKPGWQQALVAGFLAGGIAGAKYTGCIVAAAAALVFIIEFRTIRGTILFLLSSLASGVWPYFRNTLWTGDPVFPFLAARLSPNLVTTYAMLDLASDTGTGSGHSLVQLFPFLFFCFRIPAQPGVLGFLWSRRPCAGAAHVPGLYKHTRVANSPAPLVYQCDRNFFRFGTNAIPLALVSDCVAFSFASAGLVGPSVLETGQLLVRRSVGRPVSHGFGRTRSQ
jgi:Protein of unknown function (DUF1420)